eukprot:48790_1
MAQRRNHVKGTLSRCKQVFSSIIHLLNQDNTVCGHAGFSSCKNYAQSLIDVLKSEIKLSSKSLKKRNSFNLASYEMKKQKFAMQLMMIADKHPDKSSKPCSDCANLISCQIFYCYSEIPEFSRSRKMFCSSFTTATEHQFIGLCSLYCNIGRYFYRTTNICRIIFVMYSSFCKELETNLFDIDTQSIHNELLSLLEYFQFFAFGFVSNLHHLSKRKWMELLIGHNLFVKLLSLMYGQCQLVWNLFFTSNDENIIYGLVLNMHVLFIITVIGLHYVGKNIDIYSKDIKMWLDKFRKLLIVMKSDEYFEWYIKSIIFVFENIDHKKHSKIFYNKIKSFNKKCRNVIYDKSTCTNGKCSKPRTKCKYVCSRCKVFVYCSRKCQKYDWNKGQHKHLCKQYCFDPQKVFAYQ